MDPFVSLLLTAVGMFFISTLAGYLPLAATFTRRQMKNVTLLGAGMLVGTAFIVIIPEGIHMLYLNNHSVSSSKVELTSVSHQHHRRLLHDDHDNHNHTPCQTMHNPNTEYVGLALVFGFVFQLCVDHIASKLSGHMHSHSHSHNSNNSNNNNSDNKNINSNENDHHHHHHNQDIELTVVTSKKPDKPVPKDKDSSFSTFIGIIIHSAVDGIAMGTASFTEDSAMEFIIFLAVALHKAPTAFGISSVMIHSGATRSEILEKLLLFSLSAPLMSLITFFILGTGILEPQTAQDYLGLCMLFSAGTFLFVATSHVLPDLQQDGVLDTKSTIILVIGIILPYFLAIGHSHVH